MESVHREARSSRAGEALFSPLLYQLSYLAQLSKGQRINMWRLGFGNPQKLGATEPVARPLILSLSDDALARGSAPPDRRR